MIALEKFMDSAPTAANLLKELANENRLMVCCALINRELSVSQINQVVPLSQSALSQHLARLREANLVSTRKESQTVFYKLTSDEAIRIIGLVAELYTQDH